MHSENVCPLTAAVLLFVSLAAAQPTEAKVRTGVEVGLNYSTLVYERELPPWENGGRRLSLTAGTFLDVPMGGWASLVPGLRYVQQGNRIEYDTGPGAVRQVGEFRVAQNYLSLPILVKLHVVRSRRFFVTLGPEVAYLVSAHLIVEEEVIAGTSVPRTEYDDILARMERMNLSLGGGVGLEFPMENHVGMVQLRYSEGLVGTAREIHWYSDWRTRGLEGLVGLRW